MSRALRDALGQWATGVAIVTTHHDGQDVGLTCNSFASVSLEPALVLWSIQHDSNCYDAFAKGGGYCVNILTEADADLVWKFTKGEQVERFNGVDVTRLDSGRVRLTNALAWFDCELHQPIAAGDHDILLGQVQAFAHQSAPPVLFGQGKLGRLDAL
ncbi:MAG: flavin reductase family protein [Litorivicinus sp.]